MPLRFNRHSFVVSWTKYRIDILSRRILLCFRLFTFVSVWKNSILFNTQCVMIVSLLSAILSPEHVSTFSILVLVARMLNAQCSMLDAWNLYTVHSTQYFLYLDFLFYCKYVYFLRFHHSSTPLSSHFLHSDRCRQCVFASQLWICSYILVRILIIFDFRSSDVRMFHV